MESQFILIAAAVIPALILMIRIYRRDRVEKEPVSLLLSLVFTGILATFAAVLLEQVGISLLNRAFGSENLLYCGCRIRRRCKIHSFEKKDMEPACFQLPV